MKMVVGSKGGALFSVTKDEIPLPLVLPGCIISARNAVYKGVVTNQYIYNQYHLNYCLEFFEHY